MEYDQEVFSRIYGALVGVALGDSIGMPSEFFTRQGIKQKFGYIESLLDSPKENKITFGLKKGETTDDTAQTFIVAESIIENKGIVNAQDIINRIIIWGEEQISLGRKFIGPSTKKAFENIKNGMSLEESGKSGITNGGAMRIVPVGIISSFKHEEKLIDNVVSACLPTHNTNIAISSAAAIASAVTMGISGVKDLDEIIDKSIKISIKANKRGFEVVSPLVSERIKLAINIVKSGHNEEEVLDNIYNIVGTGVSSIESIPAALALVYLSKGDPIRCTKFSANLGGDTDTIGAMACGICGSIKGIQAFKQDTIDTLSKANNIDFKNISKKLLELL